MWRQAVAEFDRGLTVAKMMLKRGQFVSAMQAIEQCQTLLGVMDGIQKTARVVPMAEPVRRAPLVFGLPVQEGHKPGEPLSEPTASFEPRGGAQ